MPMLFVIDPATASVAAGPDKRPGFAPEEIAAIAAQHPGRALFVREADLDTWPDAHAGWLVSMEGGQVVGVEPDPGYTPSEPAPDPVQARLEALEAAVATNILASPHDRRWLAQKERAKLFGISWIKANPEAGQADLEAAVMADLAQQFPGEPLVVSGGVVLGYAVEAAARGYIPDGSYESLRALVVAASADQLQAMLAAL